MQNVSASLGKPELQDFYAGSVSRSREKPFPSRLTPSIDTANNGTGVAEFLKEVAVPRAGSSSLESNANYAEGKAVEKFRFAVRPRGLRIVEFQIEPSR